MPRPRSMTTDEIAAAALEVIDRDGLEGLSIRSVAGELGIGTMSLYRYFESREELERAVVELIFGTLDTDVPDDMEWADRITVLLDRFRAALSAHPEVLPLLIAHRFTSAGAMPWAEAILEALADAGYSGEDRLIAFRLLSSYVVGALQIEHFGPLPRSGDGIVAAERDPERFPRLVENAPYARSVSQDGVFTEGLQLILRGLHGPR